MISVLIPTRNRVKMLERTLNSIWDMSTSEDEVEILLRCDTDDKETLDYLKGIKRTKRRNFQVLVGPRMQGYKSLPIFLNDLAATAKGNLLMCCNDDVIFKTPNWDKVVEDVAGLYPDGIFAIGVNTVLNADIFPFYIVSRRWFNIVGFVQDTRLLWQSKFVKDVTDALGRSHYIPEVLVEHDWGGFWDDSVTRTETEKWLREVILRDPNAHLHVAEASSDEWRDDYKALHDKAVVEVIGKLKPHLDPSIKPIRRQS